MQAAEILALLPWRAPFLMIDRMIEWVPHERILTSKLVTFDDPISPGTGCGAGSFPGVLLLEGMSQSAALLFRLSYRHAEPDRLPLLGFLEARLRRTAAPGDAITFEVRSIKMTSTGGVFEAVARIGPVTLADSRLAFAAGTGR